MLDIRDLHVRVEGRPILEGVTLSVGAGEVHALMGAERGRQVDARPCACRPRGL
jgi:Iron-regulated ABC transporter ATPase subunit SufC